MHLILQPKQLHALCHRKILAIDTRPFLQYSQGHIPGAVNVDLFQFHWFDTSKHGIKEFDRQSRILISNIGVKRNQQVVFYDDVSGMSAARGVWLLLYFNHRKVSLLDGGFKRWQKEGYPVEMKTNSFIHSQFVGKPNPKILATFAEVNESIRKKRFRINRR